MSAREQMELQAPRFDRLDAASAQQLFASGPHAVAVPVRHLLEARILWLNQRVMGDDPAFHALGGDVDAYCAHLLASCAYVCPDGDEAGAAGAGGATAYADRYGGEGIGANGGSGRAGMLNGYLVKGIGRTPLIGADVDVTHASGGAYLEEAVRETIFAEIIAAEFPHAAVPTLAIIDTGIVQVWQNDFGPPQERRVLLVRPCMVRPAHFERAAGFQARYRKEGALDAQRVRHMLEQTGTIFGVPHLQAQCARFLQNWAQQLAYAFVHRLSPGGNSTSNISFDGSLLDFGACAALPSWAQIGMMQGSVPTGNEFKTLLQSARSLCYFFGRYHDVEMEGEAFLQRVVQQAWSAYLNTRAVEVLRLCGLPHRVAQDAVDGERQAQLYALVRRLLAHYREDRFDILDFTPTPRVPWDLAEVWSDSPPEHLWNLRMVLDELGETLAPQEASLRCGFFSRTRPALFRAEMKHRLHSMLERPAFQGECEQDMIARVIGTAIAAGRRDIADAAQGAVAWGVAVAPRFALVLHQCRHTLVRFAVFEWTAPGWTDRDGAALADYLAGSLPVPLHAWDDEFVVLGDDGGRLPCAVRCWMPA